MKTLPSAESHHYSLLVFSLAAMAFGLKQLLSLGTMLANIFATVCLFIACFVIILAIVHHWRFS